MEYYDINYSFFDREAAATHPTATQIPMNTPQVPSPTLTPPSFVSNGSGHVAEVLEDTAIFPLPPGDAPGKPFAVEQSSSQRTASMLSFATGSGSEDGGVGKFKSAVKKDQMKSVGMKMDSRITIFAKDPAIESIALARGAAQEAAEAYLRQRRRSHPNEGQNGTETAKRKKLTVESAGSINRLEQLRKERRLELNRESAGLSRVRRTVYTKELETALIEKGKETARLTDEVAEMRQANEMLKQKHRIADYAAKGTISLQVYSDLLANLSNGEQHK